MGVYLAFTIPVAVFPSTDFPRIVVGIDNGVAPINQMQVTVTRPIEEAMNSVPGPRKGALHHQPRLGRSQPVLQLERGYVPDAGVRERGAGARAADAARHREAHGEPPDVRGVPDSRLQPDFRHDAADRALGTGELHHQAAAESRERRVDGGAAGRPGAGVPD